MAVRVGFLRGTVVVTRVLLGQLVSAGRIVGLGLLGALSMIVSWSAAQSADPSPLEHLDNAAGLITTFTFTLVVPVIALVFGAAALGDARDDGTLVYLWLRPLGRLSVAVGATVAATIVTVPLTVLPSVASAALLDAGSELVGATLLASLLAVIAYTAIFVLLGTLTRFAVVIGLAYVFLWEGIVALFGSAGAKVALRGYANSIVTARTGVRVDLANSAQTTSIIVFVVVTVIAVLLTSARLGNLEVD